MATKKKLPKYGTKAFYKAIGKLGAAARKKKAAKKAAAPKRRVVKKATKRAAPKSQAAKRAAAKHIKTKALYVDGVNLVGYSKARAAFARAVVGGLSAEVQRKRYNAWKYVGDAIRAYVPPTFAAAKKAIIHQELTRDWIALDMDLEEAVKTRKPKSVQNRIRKKLSVLSKKLHLRIPSYPAPPPPRTPSQRRSDSSRQARRAALEKKFDVAFSKFTRAIESGKPKAELRRLYKKYTDSAAPLRYAVYHFDSALKQYGR
jgi:hypothetical protein